MHENTDMCYGCFELMISISHADIPDFQTSKFIPPAQYSGDGSVIAADPANHTVQMLILGNICDPREQEGTEHLSHSSADVSCDARCCLPTEKDDIYPLVIFLFSGCQCLQKHMKMQVWMHCV